MPLNLLGLASKHQDICLHMFPNLHVNQAATMLSNRIYDPILICAYVCISTYVRTHTIPYTASENEHVTRSNTDAEAEAVAHAVKKNKCYYHVKEKYLLITR